MNIICSLGNPNIFRKLSLDLFQVTASKLFSCSTGSLIQPSFFNNESHETPLPKFQMPYCQRSYVLNYMCLLNSNHLQLRGSFVTPLHAQMPFCREHWPLSSSFSLVANQPSSQYLKPVNNEAAAHRTVTSSEQTRKKMTFNARKDSMKV